MKVEVVDSMGTDLTVVNAARVSFDKHHEEFTSGDEKLIAYLARHGHWTPFGHPQLQFRISAPIFVARQLVKHQVGLVWNEVSRRYVDTQPVFYTTTQWRSKAKDKKQGSGNELVQLEGEDYAQIERVLLAANDVYSRLLHKGVAPEQARIVLPQSMYTEWYWSGTLYAFARVCNLRCKDDVQKETQNVGWDIDKCARKLFPASWPALRDA